MWFKIKKVFLGLALNSAQAFVAILLLISGVRGLLNSHNPPSQSIHALLPPELFIVWMGLMAAAGGLILIGLALWSPRLEIAGICSKIGAAGVYVVSLFFYGGDSLINEVLWILIVIAGIARWWGLEKMAFKPPPGILSSPPSKQRRR